MPAGEGITVAKADLAADVEAQTKAMQEAAAKKADAEPKKEEASAAAKPAVEVRPAGALAWALWGPCPGRYALGSRVWPVTQPVRATQQRLPPSRCLAPAASPAAPPSPALPPGVSQAGEGAAREERRGHDGLQEGAGGWVPQAAEQVVQLVGGVRRRLGHLARAPPPSSAAPQPHLLPPASPAAECGGDIEAASEFLRKKGLASADKKAGRVAAEGAVGAYIHAGSR